MCGFRTRELIAQAARATHMGSESVVLSRWAFALWWLTLLMIHTLAAGYNSAYALFYYELDGTYLNIVLEFLSLGMPAPYHQRIVAAYAVMGALHGVCLVLMIIGSLWHRSLRFALVPAWLNSQHTPSSSTSRPEDKTWIKRVAAGVWRKLMDRSGIFGVEGAHFHHVLIAREVMETLLQTIQAYRMSAVLPRISVNRFFVALLVLNCFAPLVVHRVFKHSEPRKRFANLVCDCVLDMMVTIAIPITIVLRYLPEYDPVLKGFWSELWYNDEWSARVQNEFQLVLVVSWTDLFSRIVFSVGLLTTTTSMKELLAYSSSAKPNQVASAPAKADIANAMNLGPAIADIKGAAISPTASMVLKATAIRSFNKLVPPQRLRRQFQLKRVYYVFVVWGLIVLGLHIHAETRPKLLQCQLQVRPWGISEPSCYLVVVDCHRLDITGTKEQIHKELSAFGASTVVQLLIKHCPTLQLSPDIQQFKHLNGFKVYNSTLVEWGADAAVTGQHHPKLIMMYLVRVNMTNGEIPQGLLSQDFPPMLIDFEIVVSNLRTLPDDLDQIWPLGSSVYIEFGNLTSVPASMIRMQSYYLSVCGNPIRELPSELFEVDNLIYLHAGSTLISELPRNVSDFSDSLSSLFLTDTEVSTFWSWIDPMASRPRSRLFAGGSPYCDALDRFETTGDDSGFAVASVPTPSTSSSVYSILMDPANNTAAVKSLMKCKGTTSAPLYPLASDDKNHAMQPVAIPGRPTTR